jgi:putative ABC transport system permease protein
MTDYRLILVFLLIAVALVLSSLHRLGLEKDIIIGTVRAFIQLMIVGYILTYIFNADDWRYMILMLIIMIGVASQNGAKRGKEIPKVLFIVTLAISTGTITTLGILIGTGIIKFTPSQVIPISGMIIGNAMVASSLVISRLKDEIKLRKGEILAALALGATSRQSINGPLKTSIKTGMIPTIDSMKTIGIVQLPGMMTGFILAGADPLQAVRYQILVAFMLTATVSIVCIMIGLLTYKQFFSKNHQLLIG